MGAGSSVTEPRVGGGPGWREEGVVDEEISPSRVTRDLVSSRVVVSVSIFHIRHEEDLDCTRVVHGGELVSVVGGLSGTRREVPGVRVGPEKVPD